MGLSQSKFTEQGWGWRAILIFLLALSIGSWSKSVQAQEIVSTTVYWQQLEDLANLIDRLENEPIEIQRAQLEEAALQLAGVTAVTLPNGREIPLNHNVLIGEMRQEEPDLFRLGHLIATVQASQESWPNPQFEIVDREMLDNILSQPEFVYREAEPSRLQQWWDSIQLRFWDWVTNLFPNANTDTNFLLNRLFIIIGSVILAVVLLYAMRDLFGDFTAESVLTPDDLMGDENLTADAALQRAQEFSTEGDYRTAVRYLYLSALLLLEERGLLRYNRALTNREYLRSVAHSPELAVILQDVIDVFDCVWYGFQPLEQLEYEKYAEQVESLKQQRGQGG